MASFLVQLLIGVALMVIGYILMPKPKKPKPPSLEDYDDPTCEAGRPIPVVFGSIKVKGLNIIYHGDKDLVARTPTSEKKK